MRRWDARPLTAIELTCLPLLVLAAPSPAPQSEESHLERGRALRRDGKREEALDAFRSGLGEHPDSALLHHEAGKSLQDLERLESAAAEYEIAARLRPEFTPPQIALGVLASRKGEFGEAARRLEAARALEPGNLAARHNLAIVYERLGRLAEALEEYRRAAAIDPREAKARYGMGSVLEKQGKLTEAAAELEGALAIDPGLSPAWYRLAQVALRLGRKEEAERHLLRFRALKAEEHLARADARLRERDPHGAIRECERALDAQPDMVEAHARLGVLRLSGRDPARALVHARRAADLDPSPARLANLSWTLHRCGRRDEALQWIEEALKLEPERKEFQEQRRKILASED